MELKIQKLSPLLGESVPFPSYATPGAAGMDLSACIDAPVEIPAGGRVVIPTGFAIETPPGYVTLVFGRSGLGVTLSNCVGVVDSDYRGELRVGLSNYSDKPFVVRPGDRIAQMALLPVATAQLRLSDSLSETERGAGGFGSTGISAERGGKR